MCAQNINKYNIIGVMIITCLIQNFLRKEIEQEIVNLFTGGECSKKQICSDIRTVIDDAKKDNMVIL